MKLLFTIRSTSHFSYISSIFDALKDDEKRVLYDKDWSYKHAPWMKTRKSMLVSFVRELRSYSNYIGKNQSEYYINRWRSYLPKYIRYFVKLRPVKFLLRHVPFEKIESLIPLDYAVTRHLKEINPDVVIAVPATHRFSAEVEYLKSAKALGIPTVVVNLSWDNLTTKGTFHIKPDMVMVWNKAQVKEAVEYHRIDEDTIQVIGAPFFDKWFNPIQLEDRAEFCDRMGIYEPYILYLGSSAKIAQDETDVVQELYTKLDCGLLVRPHPANYHNYDKLTGANLVVQTPCLAETDKELQDFYNAVMHAEAVVGINTSAMVDSIILGKRCLAIMLDRYNRTQRSAVHFNQIREYLELTRSVDDCVERLKSKPNPVKSSEDFIWDFIRPKGISLSAGKLFMIELSAWYGKMEVECHARKNQSMISYT